mmetsp:Transcript_6481/g.10901  ORF Transcript_6481/g.10901 Transcript_6481/m.10901 type:complete len:85 (-) Transcript_6481:2551-2805(-)
MPKLLLNLSQLHCFPFGQFIDFEDKHSSVFDRNNIYASELAKLSDLLRRFKDKLFLVQAQEEACVDNCNQNVVISRRWLLRPII